MRENNADFEFLRYVRVRKNERHIIPKVNCYTAWGILEQTELKM